MTQNRTHVGFSRVALLAAIACVALATVLLVFRLGGGSRRLVARTFALAGNQTVVGQPCLDNLGDARVKQLACRFMPAPGRRLQCCCSPFEEPVPGEPPAWLKCLPSFIIAGTQKSATTAVFGTLLSHPSVLAVAPTRKELHYFDRGAPGGPARYLEKGFTDYVAAWQAQEAAGGGGGSRAATRTSSGEWLPPYVADHVLWNGWKADEVEDAAAVLGLPYELTSFLAAHATGEASPSYSLQMHTPQRMRETVPAARIIMLLREPVARAHSEYQMKARRVAAQLDLASPAAAAAMAGVCDACARAWNAAMAEKEAARGRTHQGAPPPVGGDSGSNRDQASASTYGVFGLCIEAQLRPLAAFNALFHTAAAAHQAIRCLDAAIEESATPLDQTWVATAASCLGGAVRAHPVVYEKVEPPGVVLQRELQQAAQCSADVDLRDARRIEVSAASDGGSDVRQLSLGGLVAWLRRHLPRSMTLPRWLAAAAEAESLQVGSGGSAAQPLAAALSVNTLAALEWMRLQQRRSRVGGSKRLPAGMQPGSPARWRRLVADVEGWRHGNASDAGSVLLDGVHPCWRQGATSALSGDFVYRSVYFGQLVRLLTAFPADQVLVMTSDRFDEEGARDRARHLVTSTVTNSTTPHRALSRQPPVASTAIREVLAHVGLADLRSDLLLTNPRDLEDFILHQYPTFERTGWQASGAYDPLAPALEKQLRQLFEPQHALLLHWLRHLAASSTEP